MTCTCFSTLAVGADGIAQRSVSSSSLASFEKSEDVLAFINAYRENKRPDDAVEAVRAMVRFRLLKDPEQAGIYTGFIAGVIGDNQVDADRLIAGMFPMPPTAQVVLVKAIVYSGLPDWKDLLGRFVERMPSRKVLIRKYLYGTGKTLEDEKLDASPFILDAHWGTYFATGNWQSAIRIIQAMAWADADQEDIERLTIGSMAKWTLASNAARDKSLLDLCKSEMNHQPEKVRRQLRQVIEAAELYELKRIRKDALAAIDKLKSKRPKAVRDWDYWGQAGTTVLALGCVVAGALGQAQVGIPCVIGGALSTAAVKFLGPKE